MNQTNTQINEYLRSVKHWRAELEQLRAILLTCPLTEVVKWRSPCYTVDDKNIVMLASLKKHCTLSFFKGALLRDTENLLVKPGPNSHHARVMPFTSVADIVARESTIKAYVDEAIANEEAGLKPDLVARDAEPIPAEFQEQLDASPDLKAAFEALTPGRQRASILHFSGAKQSKSRAARVERYVPRILSGKGLRDCTCGLSRKLPYCDGSHKQLKQS